MDLLFSAAELVAVSAFLRINLRVAASRSFGMGFEGCAASLRWTPPLRQSSYRALRPIFYSLFSIFAFFSLRQRPFAAR
jgi:hypothetical protein